MKKSEASIRLLEPGRALLAMAVLALTWALADARAQEALRVERDLSAGWRFLREDAAGAESTDYQGEGDWQEIRLPHTWNAQDVFDDEPGYYRGIGWYRRSFDVPGEWSGRRIALRFEAACQVATVWVNNRMLGEHKGGFTPFEFDITELVVPGSDDNLIAARVDNRQRRDVPPHDMDFNIMGGLHREVTLIGRNPVHIRSLQASTPVVSASEGVVEWTVEVDNLGNAAARVEVLGALEGPSLDEPVTLSAPAVEIPAGQASRVTRRMPAVASPRLWSPDSPALYSLALRLRVDGRIVDEERCALGFRWFRFDAAEGFFLNGAHLKLRGVNRHDDYPGLGWALPRERHVADLELIKQLGANFVRTAHYAQHPVVLDTCDRLGLLVWEEVPFDGEGPWRPSFRGARDFAQTLEKNLRETLLRDRNHPCILLWGLGNENLDSGRKPEDRQAVVELTRRLEQVVRELDPTRPTAVAINKVSKGEESGLVEVPDVVAYNLYQGWYSSNFEGFRKTVDEFRERHPDKPLIVSEYGAGSEKGRHTLTPERQDFSEEYACQFHEFYWGVIESRPFVAGSLVWNVFDFAVERRGRTKKQTIPHMNQKGLFTYDRQPKDVYYFYLSRWSDEPMVYIVSHTWTERPAGVASIRVYSNGEEVELFLNERSLGARRQENGLLWNVPLEPGDNSLRAVARRGEKSVSDHMSIRCK